MATALIEGFETMTTTTGITKKGYTLSSVGVQSITTGRNSGQCLRLQTSYTANLSYGKSSVNAYYFPYVIIPTSTISQGVLGFAFKTDNTDSNIKIVAVLRSSSNSRNMLYLTYDSTKTSFSLWKPNSSYGPASDANGYYSATAFDPSRGFSGAGNRRGFNWVSEYYFGWTAFATSSAITMANDTWYPIELKFVMGASGSAVLKFNSTQIINYSGTMVPTTVQSGGFATSIASIVLCNSILIPDPANNPTTATTGPSHYFDDLYLIDTSTGSPTDFIGDSYVFRPLLSSNVSNTWNTSSTIVHYSSSGVPGLASINAIVPARTPINSIIVIIVNSKTAAGSSVTINTPSGYTLLGSNTSGGWIKVFTKRSDTTEAATTNTSVAFTLSSSQDTIISTYVFPNAESIEASSIGTWTSATTNITAPAVTPVGSSGRMLLSIYATYSASNSTSTITLPGGQTSTTTYSAGTSGIVAIKAGYESLSSGASTGVRIATCSPSTNTCGINLVLAPNITQYIAVNEADQDGDSSYIYTSTDANRDIYGKDNLTQSGAVVAVQVNIIAKQASGTGKVSPVIQIGGTAYDGTAQTTTNSYASYKQVYDTQPSDSTAWTKAKVDAANIGVKYTTP